MKHDKLKEKIMGLYDGPVTEKERIWVETHLASCADCSQSVEEYKQFASTLFAVPSYSEAEEDIFTAKVMSRIHTAAATATQSVFDIVVRWFVPLLGSTAVAAWVFFSVIPSTPGLSNEINGVSFFTEDASEINASAVSPVASSNTNEEMVVSWLKE